MTSKKTSRNSLQVCNNENEQTNQGHVHNGNTNRRNNNSSRSASPKPDAERVKLVPKKKPKSKAPVEAQLSVAASFQDVNSSYSNVELPAAERVANNYSSPVKKRACESSAGAPVQAANITGTRTFSVPGNPTDATAANHWISSGVKQVGNAIYSLIKPRDYPSASAVDDVCSRDQIDEPKLDPQKDDLNLAKRMARKRKMEDCSPEPMTCDDIIADEPDDFSDGMVLLPASMDLREEAGIASCENSVRHLKLTGMPDKRISYYMPAGKTDGHEQYLAIVKDLTDYFKRVSEIQKMLPLTPVEWNNPVKTGHHLEDTLDAKKKRVTKY